MNRDLVQIRDSETAKIAVRASITGHLVLSTIHTNNSLSTIERLLDMKRKIPSNKKLRRTPRN